MMDGLISQVITYLKAIHCAIVWVHQELGKTHNLYKRIGKQSLDMCAGEGVVGRGW